MQRLLWPTRTKISTDAIDDGFTLVVAQPDRTEITDIQAVLTVRHEANAKRMWNVYTRRWLPEDEEADPGLGEWEYYDGLEFRHFEEAARKEFRRRAHLIRNGHE